MTNQANKLFLICSVYLKAECIMHTFQKINTDIRLIFRDHVSFLCHITVWWDIFVWKHSLLSKVLSEMNHFEILSKKHACELFGVYMCTCLRVCVSLPHKCMKHYRIPLRCLKWDMLLSLFEALCLVFLARHLLTASWIFGSIMCRHSIN